MKCTAKQALDAFAYWLGYYEKASKDYSTTREKSAFEANKGSNNYCYPAYFCGNNPAPWCAYTVTTAITEACGDKDDARAVMFGVWPYANCGQLWDAADNQHRFWSYYQRYTLGKGDRENYTPVPGDVIIFTDNLTSRSHTGMVYAVSGGYVYTYEGNSGNQCRKRSYNLTDKYIFGYVKPLYAEGGGDHESDTEQYGPIVYADIGLHQLSTGCAGPEVKTVQRILYAYGVTDDYGGDIAVDGAFGQKTKQAVKKLQRVLGLTQDGIVGKDTWKKMLTEL